MNRPRRAPVRLVGCLLALGLWPDPAAAGLHYSGEQYAELPSRLRGFLVDQRALRAIAVERPGDLPASHLRDEYRAAAARLEKLRQTRPLSADEAADLGAVLVRLGRPGSAVDLLVPAARRHPEHFRLAANLGTALQLAGDLERAAERLEEAVRLAPANLRDAERWHLRLVRLRLREGRAANVPSGVDDLFGARYDGGPGQMTEADRQKLPADAVAVVQQLALWLPADARLLWQLGELANAYGDVRTAAAILDGCVTELALNSAELRRRRRQLRAAADQLASKPELDLHQVLLRVKSSRPLVPSFDESTLPPVQADRPNPLPWPLLTATSIDARGRPAFPKHLERLDGKTVTLTGFMQPVRDELSVTGFLLLEFPVGCWFCETPELNGLVSVELRPGRTADFQKSLVKVTGTLTLNRTDPEAYLFRLTDAVVGPVE